MEKKKYSRNCPKCFAELIYISYEGFRRAKNNQLMCRKCSHPKKKKINIEKKRKLNKFSFLTKELIEEEYYINNRNFTQIAQKYECCTALVTKLAKKYNIKRKTGKDNYLRIIEERKKFGQLLPIEVLDLDKFHHYILICKCDCGNTAKIAGYKLLTNNTKTCGKCCRKGKKHHKFNGHEEITGIKWGQIKTRAKKAEFEFNITIEYCWDLFLKQNRKCALSGLNLDFGTIKNKSDGTASLDRIDSSKGYIFGNVQWVHKHINQMKLDHSENYFIELCNKISEYNKQKNIN